MNLIGVFIAFYIHVSDPDARIVVHPNPSSPSRLGPFDGYSPFVYCSSVMPRLPLSPLPSSSSYDSVIDLTNSHVPIISPQTPLRPQTKKITIKNLKST